MLSVIIIGLNNKSRLFKLLFSALILDFINKPGVKDADSFQHVGSRSNLKYALFEESSDFRLTGILVLKVFLQEERDVRVLSRSSSATLLRRRQNVIISCINSNYILIYVFTATFRFGVLSLSRFVCLIERFYRGRTERGIATGHCKHAGFVIHGHELIQTFLAASLAGITLTPDQDI